MLATVKRGLLGLAWRAWKHGSLPKARFLQRHLDQIVTPALPDPSGISIPELGIVIDYQRHEYVIDVLPELVELKRRRAAEFRVAEDGALEIHIANVRIATETRWDILTVCEVFQVGLYDARYSKPAVVWDIGANIGCTALFFARGHGWRVFAYEPFPRTADMAARNIALNDMGGRIELRVAAVGGSSRREAAAYHHERRGGNGLFGNLGDGDIGQGSSVEVEVLDAAVELRRIRASAGPAAVIVKMDCEGAEYEILRRLRDAECLGEIDCMILEVHPLPHEDPAEPVAILVESGMIILGQVVFGQMQMVYAARLKHGI